MKRTNEPTMYGTNRWMGFGALLSIATLSVSLGATGCKKQPDAADAFVQAQSQTGPDPAAANMAPVNDSVVQSAPPPAQQGKVLGIRSESQSYTQQGESYQNGPAPIVRQAPSGSYAQDDSQYYDNGDYQTDVDQGQAALEADQAPPPLPVYTQPEAPEPDDLWTPGYWDYAPQGGYYWVPGAWVAAPYSGALWTPGYWGYYGHRYRFHRGYWGLHIGFYGGIPYGFGYTGVGYEGGYWHENHFFYNRAVNRVNVNVIRNVYVRNVTINNYNTRVSYNGGPGGLNVRPRPAEIAALRESHTPPMQAQIQHAREAQANRQQFFDQNRGRPAQVVLTRNLPADRGVQAPPVRRGFGGQRPNETPNAGPGAARGGFGQPNQAQPFQRPGQAPAQQQPGQQQRPIQQQPNQRLEQPGQQQHPVQQPNQRIEPGRQQQPQQQVRPAEPQLPVQANPQIQQQQQMQQHPVQQPNQRFEPGRQQPPQQQQVRPAEPQRPVQPNPQAQQQQLEQQREAQQQQQRNQQMQQHNVQQQQQRQPEVQRAPQPQAQPHPQPEARPQPQQARPQPQPRPQPQAQPHPQPQPHEEHH